MERFLGSAECGLRVFMVWNSPAWMYGVRHQRGLESLLHHHSDACVVMFSETMELDFFSSFVKEGIVRIFLKLLILYKIVVAMPNLDELFNNTPVQVFATVRHEWRKTKYYPIHYSELVRLAALYKDAKVILRMRKTSILMSLANAHECVVYDMKTEMVDEEVINKDENSFYCVDMSTSDGKIELKIKDHGAHTCF